MCSEAEGPPSDCGKSVFQPTCRDARLTVPATVRGVVMTSGDRATEMPVGRTPAAPRAELRTMSTHRLESGTHASTGASPAIVPIPDSSAATAPGESSVTSTWAQWPATSRLRSLKYWPICCTAGAMSRDAATCSRTGPCSQSARTRTARTPITSTRAMATAAATMPNIHPPPLRLACLGWRGWKWGRSSSRMACLARGRARWVRGVNSTPLNRGRARTTCLSVIVADIG